MQYVLGAVRAWYGTCVVYIVRAWFLAVCTSLDNPDLFCFPFHIQATGNLFSYFLQVFQSEGVWIHDYEVPMNEGDREIK